MACSLTSTHLEPLTLSALISGVSAAFSSGVMKLEPATKVSVLRHQNRYCPVRAHLHRKQCDIPSYSKSCSSVYW
ncbi:hypothetical protein KC364_g90 [Hortaea werneckii]|nr:hypothetical protein KC364_g90 [Hortaea werneckii]